MPRFNSTGWEKISKPCIACGVDMYYIKTLEDGKVDTKQFHKRSCPSLPILKEFKHSVNIVDAEFKEIEETKFLK